MDLVRLCLLVALLAISDCPVAHADPTLPPVWDIVAEDFESGDLDAWRKVSADDLSLTPGSGQYGSTGLSVTIGRHESYLYQTDIAKAEEAYITFWFNPNGASIPDKGTSWIPGKSIRIASVKGTVGWHVLVALRVRRPEGEGYKAYLEWYADDGMHYDYQSGEFDLTDGWQRITLGFRVDEWVAVWLNDVQVREIVGITHGEAFGELVEIGKVSINSSMTPAGTLRYDDVAFQIPRVDDLWVSAANGDDRNDGLTPATAFHTIQKAADTAGPGTTVHILPGIYRETVWPVMDGSAAESVVYLAEDGSGTTIIRGSEPASSLTWTQLAANTIGLPSGVDPANVYYTDLSAWGLNDPPRFVVELDGSGKVVTRLPLAREPDGQVSTEWKYHEFWWAADGGSDVAGCDPTTNANLDCDYAWRSMTQLTDRTHDTEPPGVQQGNLTTLGNLTGATLVAVDTYQGHYVYRRIVSAHNVAAGCVTVDEKCELDPGSGEPGLGWGSKYYVEGHPALLDNAGEWWYDTVSNRLYLWPPTPGNPATMDIEISRRTNGFSLENRSFTVLDGLVIEILDGNAIYQGNYYAEKSYHNTVRNVTLRYANRGVEMTQSVRADAPPDNITEGFTLQDSKIAHMDTHAIRLTDWWETGAAADDFIHSGIVNTVIRNNEMHHLGFRSDSDNAVGVTFQFANKLRFEDNYVHHVAHNGVQFSKSVIQSERSYGFTPDEIKTGEILISDNVFERACQLTADCGALKIWGTAPDNHIHRDLLITGNVFRNTFGWTYVSEKRGRWAGGTGSDVRGTGGFGLYVDMASGVHIYRNIAYNNAHTNFMFSGVWRDGDVICYNNIAANSLYGFRLGGASFDTHGSVNTQVVNNISVNNEGFGILQDDADGVYNNMIFDHNLYYGDGWRAHEDGGIYKPGAMAIYRGPAPNEYYQTVADIQANTPWEVHGTEGDPVFWDYDPADHDLDDGSWPDFHLTAASVNALDKGTAELPASLETLLNAFDVEDPQRGEAFDIGRYEGGFALLVNPSTRIVNPGGVAHYTLRLHPPDLPHTVILTIASPSPSIVATIDPMHIAPGAIATLTVTDTHVGSSLLPGLRYSVPITGTGGGFTQTTSVNLLVGGRRVYLPSVIHDISWR